MAFTIPNESEAPADGAQATVYQTDVDILVQALGGDGVISGCAVTAQGSPNNTVAVAAGVVRINGEEVTVSSGNVTMPSADGSNPRWVLITVNDAGTKAATGGTAAANPLLPALPADSVALAAVWLPANDTTVASSQITDKRTFPSLPGEPLFNPAVIGATRGFHIPGQGGATTSTRTLNATRTYYLPFFAPQRMTITDIQCEVTASSGTLVRLGLYNADEDWNPTSLVADWGTVSTSSTGVKTITLGSPTVIPRGQYCIAMSTNGSPTFRSMRAPVLAGVNPSMGASPYYAIMFANSAGGAGALPDPADAPDDAQNASSGAEHMVVLRYTR